MYNFQVHKGKPTILEGVSPCTNPKAREEVVVKMQHFSKLKKDTSVVQLRSMTAECEEESKQVFIFLGWVPTPEKVGLYRRQCSCHGKYIRACTDIWIFTIWLLLMPQTASSVIPAWADLTPADYSTDIPKSKCQRASAEIYLELLLHLINYWISVLIFERLSHWNVGPKSKCGVTVWQFDVSHNRKKVSKKNTCRESFWWRHLF